MDKSTSSNIREGDITWQIFLHGIKVYVSKYRDCGWLARKSVVVKHCGDNVFDIQVLKKLVLLK